MRPALEIANRMPVDDAEWMATNIEMAARRAKVAFSVAEPERLGWHIGENLRWLAENPGAGHVPCGWLTGLFLNTVAAKLDALAAAASGGDNSLAPGEAPQSGPKGNAPDDPDITEMMNG